MKVKVPIGLLITMILVIIIAVVFAYKVIATAMVFVFYGLLVLAPIIIYLFRKKIWAIITGKKPEENAK